VRNATGRHFVEPENYADLKTTLWRYGTVVLKAPHGSGKTALAVRLLAECQERLAQQNKPQGGIFRIKMGWRDLEDREMPQSPGRCYLLDLSGSGDDLPSADFGDVLLQKADDGRYSGIYLAVLVTAEVWRKCQAVADKVTRIVSAPPAEKVVERHLRWKFSLSNYQEWLDDLSFIELISRIERPLEAEELAEEIARNVNRSDVREARKEVLDRFKAWKGYLSTWFENNKKVQDRATMISAALLDPDTPAEIVNARNQLLKILREEELIEGPLAGPGRSGYLKLLQASPIGNKYSISHRRSGLDEAVILYVWDEWPQAQPHLENWLLALATRSSNQRVKRIAKVVVKAAIQANSKAFLGLVKKIASERPDCKELALEILDLTALDARVGASVRNRLRSWVSGDNENLAAIAVEVCGRVLGQERPTLALRRVSEALSRDPIDKRHRSAEDAIVALASDEESRFAIFDTVRDWISAQPRVGLSAFLNLAARSPGFVEEALRLDEEEKGLCFFRSGWSLALSAGVSQRDLVFALGKFLDHCEKVEVSRETVYRIVGPTLADSLNKSLAMAVLMPEGSAELQGDRGSAIRSHLIRELIWGRLGEVAKLQIENLNGDSR